MTLSLFFFWNQIPCLHWCPQECVCNCLWMCLCWLDGGYRNCVERVFLLSAIDSDCPWLSPVKAIALVWIDCHWRVQLPVQLEVHRSNMNGLDGRGGGGPWAWTCVWNGAGVFSVQLHQTYIGMALWLNMNAFGPFVGWTAQVSYTHAYTHSTVLGLEIRMVAWKFFLSFHCSRLSVGLVWTRVFFRLFEDEDRLQNISAVCLECSRSRILNRRRLDNSNKITTYSSSQ